MLNVIQQHEDGETYANIANIARLPRGVLAPKPTNPFVYVWLTSEEFDIPAFNKLSDKMKETIIDSPEYQAILNPGAPEGPPPVSDMSEFEDEVPF
jgi:hypothetical protein